MMTIEHKSQPAKQINQRPASIKDIAVLLAFACILAVVASKCLLAFERESHLRFWEKSRLAAEAAFLERDYQRARQQNQAACGHARSLGADDYRLGLSMQELAAVYVKESRINDAEAAYREAVRVFEYNCRAKDSITVGLMKHMLGASLKGLGSVLCTQGKLPEAKRAYKQALEAYGVSMSGSASDDSPLILQDLAEIWAGLGLVCFKQQKFSEADTYYKQALNAAEKSMISENTLNQIKAQVSELLLKTGRVKRVQLILPSPRWDKFMDEGALAVGASDLDSAEKKYRKGLQQAERLGPNDVRVVKTRLELAAIHRARGNLAAAEKEMSRGIEILNASPTQNDELMYTLHEYADVLIELKEFSKAKTQLKRLIEVQENVCGNQSPKLAASLSQLALVEVRLNKPDLARSLLQRAEKQLVFARERKRTRTLSSIVNAYLLLGDIDKALSLAQTNQEICQKHLAASDRQWVIAYYELARCYCYHGDLAKADEAFKKALEAGSAHKEIMRDVYELYIHFLKKSDRQEEAKAFEQRLKEMQLP